MTENKQKNEKSKITKALIYCRVSTKKQAKEGSGLESQKKRALQYCQAKGYEVSEDRVFEDAYSGGGDFMHRPAMSSIIEFLDSQRKGKNEWVLVFDDLKRFARDTEFHIKLRRELQRRNCRVESLNFKFEGTPEGEFIEVVIAAQNELERKQNARQVRQKMQARMERGLWVFRFCPKGYSYKKTKAYGKFAVQNDQAKYIKEGLEGFACKKFSTQKALAKFWQDKGIFPKTRSPEKYLDAVKDILTNPFYMGIIEYEVWGVKDVEGLHEPMISPKVFLLNKQRLQKEGRARFTRQALHPSFPHRGLVCCAGCGDTLRSYVAKKKHRYYECKNLDCPLKYKSIKAADIEQDFKNLLSGLRPKKELLALSQMMFDDIWENQAKQQKQAEAANQKKQIRIEQEIQKLVAEIPRVTSDLVKQQYEKAIETKASELENLSVSLDQKPDVEIPCRTAYQKVEGMLRKPYKIWDEADLKQKQELFFFFFDSRLKYARKTGCRTPEKSCFTKLFEQSDNPSSAYVNIRGLSSNEVRDFLVRWYHYFSDPKNARLLEV